MNDKGKLIQVCADCGCASCWYGEFMCDTAKGAGTVWKTRAELDALVLESPEYWTDEKLKEVYGTSDIFPAPRPLLHQKLKDYSKETE